MTLSPWQRRTFTAPLVAFGLLAVTLGAVAMPRDLGPGAASTPGPESAAFSASIIPVGPADIQVGQSVHLQAMSTRPGFGSLYVVNASGRVQVWAENLRVRPGRPLSVPNPGFTILATAPGGEETLVFLVTRDRFAGFLGGATATRPTDLGLSRDELSRGLRDRLADLPAGSFASAEARIRVYE